MSLLVSWIGLADFKASGLGDENDLGPVGLALASGSFDRALLFSDQAADAVAAFVDWMRGRARKVQIETHRVDLSNPSAFAEIFAGVTAVLDAQWDALQKSGDVTFYLSPGTPVMAATWLILGKTRYAQLPVRFVESSMRRLNWVDVPFDLAANILPDVVRLADEQLTARGEGRVHAGSGFGDILYTGPEMTRLVEKARKVARRSMNVLIEGESGTGKELLANALHREGLVADGPFQAVNCGAIPATLIESELFGHEKNSFTGADKARVGLIESADGGTLFLDEIGELPLSAQVKLLRVLQERKVVRIGATVARAVNIRVVAATHRDLAHEVAAGRFREDLFYRLCVVKLRLPPLRERSGDLELLVDRVLSELNAEGARDREFQPRILTARARARLLAHEWRGNVRELQNTLQRLVFLADNAAITPADVEDALLPAVQAGGDGSGILNRTLGPDLRLKDVQAEVAGHYIRRALRATGNRVSRAAELLGTSRQNLSNWMREYGIP